MTTRPIIKASGLQQKFVKGDEMAVALQEATFSLTENSTTILFGASGSGKSTILNILSGILPPSSGHVEVQGQNVYEHCPDELSHYRANNIGFIHQSNYWIKSLNVIENVSVPLFFLGYSRKEAAKVAIKSLDRLGMASYAKKSPVVLSGGEQQRIAVARALVNDPPIIIADEPTGNLDTENGDMIMRLLLTTQIESKRTLIIVTHNMEYLSLADHLLKIQDGRLEDVQGDNMKIVVDKLMSEIKHRSDGLLKMKQNAKK